MKVHSVNMPFGRPAASRSITTEAQGAGASGPMPQTCSAREFAIDTSGSLWRHNPHIGRMYTGLSGADSSSSQRVGQRFSFRLCGTSQYEGGSPIGMVTIHSPGRERCASVAIFARMSSIDVAPANVG